MKIKSVIIYVCISLVPLTCEGETKILFPNDAACDLNENPQFATFLKKEKFLVLHEKAGRFFITPAKIHCITEDYSPKMVSNVEKPVIYLQDANLVPGEVNPATIDWIDPIAPTITDHKLKISLSHQDYYLYKERNSIVMATKSEKDPDLSLGSIRNPAYDPRKMIGGDVVIDWAGDIDRDGKLDLITTFRTEYLETSCLSLSSSAHPPHLVREVACEDFSD